MDLHLSKKNREAIDPNQGGNKLGDLPNISIQSDATLRAGTA